MPKGRVSVKPAIMEHAGFKVGEKVFMTAEGTPDGIGEITKIFMDREAKEMACVVSVATPEDDDPAQDWQPVFFDEIKKAVIK
jgi:hypothetical protein